MTLPTPLYYLGGTTKDFKEFWSQREHVSRDKKWHYQRMWTDKQVIKMLEGIRDYANPLGWPYGAFSDLISQLRGGRDGNTD